MVKQLPWKRMMFTITTLLYSLCLGIVSPAVLYKIPLKRIRDFPLVKIHDHSIVRRAVEDDVEKKETLEYELNNLQGQPGLGYYMEMGIGTPPQLFNILIDTGSSNFAVAAAPNQDVNHFFNTSLSTTYDYDGTNVYVPYTQGDWTGPLAHDRVTIPSMPSINVTADIAFITDSNQFFQNGSDWQGILGLAYSVIARPDASVEVFVDSLKSQTNMDDIFSLQLCGVVDLPGKPAINTGGSLIFGGIDDTLYTGELQYAPIYKEWYYEVIITHMTVNGIDLGLDCKEYNFDKTIVDSGTTNLRLPRKVYDAFLTLLIANTKAQTLTGKIPTTFWMEASELCWVQYMTPWNNFPDVVIQLAASDGTVFDLEISPQQYLREVEDVLNPSSTKDCFKFAVSPSDTGTVLGAIFMEGFYVVFDRRNKTMGFAQSSCATTHKHTKPSKVSNIKPVNYNTTQCAYIKPDFSETTLSVVAYIMITLTILSLIPVIIFIFQCQYHKHCKNRRTRSDFDKDDNNLLGSDSEIPRKYSSIESYR